MKHPNNCKNLLIAAMLLSAYQAVALESDRDQPVEIESDSAAFDETSGLTSYRGNVRLVQGSIELLADLIELYSENEQIVELVATGNPAYYEQLPEEGAEKLIARGNTIRYQLNDDLILLEGSASLSQQGTTLSGGSILYDVRQHILRASAENGAQSTQERVRVTLPPLGGSRENP